MSMQLLTAATPVSFNLSSFSSSFFPLFKPASYFKPSKDINLILNVEIPSDVHLKKNEHGALLAEVTAKAAEKS